MEVATTSDQPSHELIAYGDEYLLDRKDHRASYHEGRRLGEAGPEWGCLSVDDELVKALEP